MQAEVRLDAGEAATFGALALATSIAMGGTTLLARTGLGFPSLLLATGIAIVALATLGPAVWAMRAPDRQYRVGPLAAILLIASCGLVGLLGTIGAVLVWALALGCLAALWRHLAGRRCWPGAASILLGCLIALAGALLFSIELGGTKYVNFLLDQIVLQGRADGDDYLNAALTHAFGSHLVPAPGIDGLAPARYHFGFYALAATLMGLSGGDAALALIALQMIVLVPLLGFALAQGAVVIGGRLFPGWSPHPLLPAALSFVLVPLAQLSGVGNLVTHSTSMLIGGVMLGLLAPAFLGRVPIDSSERGRSGRPWWLAALAIPVLAVAKISAGYLWTAVAGYLALRKIGLRQPGFWLVALAMAALFFGSLYLFVPAGGNGGALFGVPYYVERGFAEGDYLLPLKMQWQSLAALGALLFFRARAIEGFRRLLLEALVIAILAANLPGLLMQIPGGDAAYFLVAGEWFAAPILLAFLAVAAQALPAASRTGRIAGWAAAAGAAAILLVGLLDTVPLRANTFVAAQALVHTGDRSFFSEHKRRALKADAKRALESESLLALMRRPVAEPLGRRLADALRAAGGARATGAIAFAAPASEYWSLVGECDGRTLWPMAVAGVSMLAGHTANKTVCPDEGPLLGGTLPDVTLSPAPSRDELCALAAARGFTAVLVIGALQAAPERVDCKLAASGLGSS